MTKILKEKLEEKKDKLLEIYNGLKKLQKLSLKEIQDDKEHFWAVNYGLVVAIEAILDIGQYILSDRGIKAESYSQVIPLLVKHKVLPKKYAEKIKGMVNFRNTAVHAYLGLNENLVYKFLHNDIEDFKNFLKYIQKVKKSQCREW
ncbi:DUF86 domain-containing protein [Patescibacteria group bacterium]|nr:DUF86 domain-containing protein [Patescibacteria group bacterium]MBU1420909.1 DUF86 domain-containing protein [Patescibacteria group bacterium]MBU2456840.1 DUF86 domain-containing protein [Patescibacteria group bacterium]